MSNQLMTMQDKESMAMALCKSGLFGLKDQSQALALMALCEAEGLHPAHAVRDYHIVQGRPAMKADAMLARFQNAGGSVNWTHYSDDRVTGVFSHAQGGSITVTWTIEQAKKIGLTGKDNWRNYPRNMLRARCISEGVRAIYPGIAVGVYTPEEIRDMPQSAREVDMGSVEIIDEPDPWTQDLAKAAEEAAKHGMTAYTTWWKSMSDDFRRAAVKTSTHADMKALASEASVVNG
jgi:hypothetical protein